MGAVLLELLIVCMAGQAGRPVPLDRVAVVVGKDVITEGEVLEELRLEEFIASQPLDLGPKQRLAAANRLVEQQLIRQEMAISQYKAPDAGEAKAMLRNFRQERFPAEAGFRGALEKYGITEDQLTRHLLWQLTVMRFTDQRFPAMPDDQSRDRLAPGAEDDVEKQMDAWLKQARSSTRVVFKKEAFQ